MCVKEFFGYSCGHCSPPKLIICPLTAQDPTFLPCPVPAERSIPAAGQSCPGCSRALWNKGVIDNENEHRVLHEHGQCSFHNCGVAFTEEERKDHKSSTANHRYVDIIRAVKQGLDASVNAAPQVSHFHGMVVEYSEDNDESAQIPSYSPARFDTGKQHPDNHSANQPHTPHYSHEFGIQTGQNFQGNHSANRRNPECDLEPYKPFQKEQAAHGRDTTREMASRNGNQNTWGSRRRQNRTGSRGSFNNFRGNAESGRSRQQGTRWEQNPNLSCNNREPGPLNSAPRPDSTAADFYKDQVDFKVPDYAKSSTSQASATTVPHSPLSTPDRLLTVPQGHFHAYDPEHSSYPIPEILKATSPGRSANTQNQMNKEQTPLAENTDREVVKERKNAAVEFPSEAAFSDLVVAVQGDLHISSPSPETTSHPDTPINTPAESKAPSPAVSPKLN